MDDDESPETMLRSVLKRRLREGASPEAIQQELAGFGLSAEQARALAREVSAERASLLDHLSARMPLLLAGLLATGVVALSAAAGRATLAMTLAALGYLTVAGATLGLIRAMTMGGRVGRMNLFREHSTNAFEGVLGATDRYILLFGLLGVGIAVTLVGVWVDPMAGQNLWQALEGLWSSKPRE